MSGKAAGEKVRIALIGAGAVADFHHVPGMRIDGRAELAAICDPNRELLARRMQDWAAPKGTADYEEIAEDPQIDAVIIGTPNYLHGAIALACIARGKHVMCEKPLGLNAAEALRMCRAARERGVRHMTAFTYRFAPSMRYLKHLVSSGALGTPRHFRSQRFLDLPETSWGWRQRQEFAGAGDLYDMTIHRIDFAQDLLGPIRDVCGAVARFAPRDKTADGAECDPSDVDDWSALIGRFEGGAFGVWEGSTLMKGHHNSGLGYEWAEINGSEGSAVYQLGDPNHILLGQHGGSLKKEQVPAEFLVPPGSPRDPREGPPSTVFRYDLVHEFVSAIVEGRDAVPGFDAGASAQVVADAVLESNRTRAWVAIDGPVLQGSP
jgi:predicted dehydrogenase